MQTHIKYGSNQPLVFHQGFTKICEVDIHIHDTYEIYQALSPNIRYFVEGAAYDLAVGDIIITSSREIHRPITLDQESYGRRFVQFDPSRIQSFLDIEYNPLHIFENRKLGQNNHIIVPKDSNSVIDRYFHTIEAAIISGSPRHLYEGWLILQSLLIELEILFTSSHSNQDNITPIDASIFEVRSYLDEHFTQAFRLDDVSKKHHLDKYHLSRLFKESTGFTLLEYIQSKRIRHAKTLLASNSTILEISQECGYDDYTNFYKTFKKMTKMSPKEYRATLLG